MSSALSELCSKLRASLAEAQLLSAICCPESGQGLIAALTRTETALGAYFEYSELPRVEAWLKVCHALADKCEDFHEGGFVDLGLAPDKCSSVFAELASKAVHRPTGEAAVKTDQLLGLVLAGAISSNTQPAVLAIQAWSTLRRAGRGRKGAHADWGKLIDAVPVSTDEIEAALGWVTATGLRELLEEALHYGDAAVDAPPVDAPKATTADGTSVGLATDGRSAKTAFNPDLHEDPDTERPASKKRERKKRDDTKAKKNPIGWLIKSANYGRYVQRFGLVGDRDHQHPLTLQLVCQRLKAKFSEGDFVARDRVAFSHVSLRSALPGRLALHLPVAGTSYPRLDITRGELLWCYRQALDSNRDEDGYAPPLGPTCEEHVIRLVLDADIAQLLRLRRLDRPDAKTMGELVGVGQTEEAQDAWLYGYRRFLREHGDPAHPPYDARYAGSLGDVYRHACNNDILAAFLALDFQPCAMGLLHYLTFPAQYIAERDREVFDFLSWRMPDTSKATGVQGSDIHISPEEFRDGWSKLQDRTRAARDELVAAVDAAGIAGAFNTLTNCRLLAFIAVTAHRGKKLSRLTIRALFTHRDTLHFFDKDVGEYQSNRVVPAHSLADRVLAAFQSDLQLLERRVHEVGVALQADGRRAVLGANAIQTAFFNLRCDSAKAVSRTPVVRSLVESEAKASFARPLNIGRHFLVSQLFMAGTSTWLVQVLTGHSRKHAEPFNDGMSVPPQWALRQLRDAIERVFLSLDLAPVAGETSPALTRRLAVPFGALPAPASDDYINPRLTNPQRVLPPPFDEFTTVALRVIDEARAIMVETPTFASTGQGFVASQTLFDLMDPVDQQTVFSSLAESIMQLGNAAWMAWKREASNQEICLRLSDRSVIELVGIDRNRPGSWREHAEGVGRWARSVFPELAWPADDFEAHRLLAALALRYRRYRCSPSLLTAGSTVVHAATFSRRSLLRIDEPGTAQIIESRLGKVRRKGQPKGIPAEGEGPIYDLAEELRKVSKKNYPVGGEIQRSVDWEAAVERLDLRGDKRAAALKDAMAEEARLLGEQVDEADKTSTLAGYLGEVLPALELLPRWSDLRTMPGVAIARWVEAAKDEIDELKKDTLAVKNKRTRWFGLKRFLVTGKRLGWVIPKGLFASDGERVFFDGLRKSAASAALLERDHAPIRRLLADHFEDWPVLASRAELASHMLEQAPLRSTEQVVTRVACTIDSCSTLLIEPDVFSHLKSEHAYRPIQIDATLLQRLQDAANDPASPNDEFLFISEDGADWSASMEIDEALVSAAAQVTGDAHVRKHSFRAAAICRRMWPTWEVTARALISGSSSPGKCRAALETEYARGFTTIVLAARTAGHGLAIVTLAYYSPPWTFMLSAQLAETLADLPPSSNLARCALESGNSRSPDQLLSEPAGQASDAWTSLARHCLDRLKLPRLLAVDPPAVVAPRPHEAPLDDPSVSQSIRFLSNALLGENDKKAAHNNGIATPYSRRLLSQVPLQDRGVLVKRRRGEPTAEALDEDRDFLNSKEAEPLIASLLRSSLTDLKNLCDDLAIDRPNARGRPLGADALLARLKAHLNCLPAVASLHVRFGPKRSPHLTDERLKALGDRLIVGKPNERIGPQPQIQLIDSAHPKSSEYAGRWTVVTRVLITAIQAYVNVSRGV